MSAAAPIAGGFKSWPEFPTERLIPPAFVFLWSTGFVAARLVAGHAEPFTFLIWRFAIAGVILAAVAGFARRRLAARPLGFATPMAAGILIHGLYLGAIFWSVDHGLPAGISALIASLQPILTAASAGRCSASGSTSGAGAASRPGRPAPCS